MLIIAHRGASLQHPENTITAFHFAADNGADIIEMDIRRTVDGHFVIFHDATLERVDGTNTPVHEMTYAELAGCLNAARWPQPLTMEMLALDYKRATPLLFHIKIEDCETELTPWLDRIPVRFYLGTVTLPATAFFSHRYGKERVLAFMSKLDDGMVFMQHGAGIIRLWEHWLEREALQTQRMEPSVLRYKRAGAHVWVMTCGPTGTGMTDMVTLNKLAQCAVDGVLINDVNLGQDWKQQNRNM